MASKAWAATKVVVATGAVVYVVSIFAGPQQTSSAIGNAVEGTAWGIGTVAEHADRVSAGLEQASVDAGDPPAKSKN